MSKITKTHPKAVPGDTPMPPPRSRRYYNLGAAAVVLGMLILVGIRSGQHETAGADSFSDLDVLMAGENLATYGFVNLHFLPVLYVGELSPSFQLYYTHYPPLSENMNGLMRVVGIDSLFAMRFFCGLFAVVGLYMMSRALAPFIGELAALLGLAFVGSSGFFVGYATSLHQFPYNLLFMGTFFLCFLRAVHRDSPHAALWALAWGALFLESLVSFEWILYPQFFAWVYVLGTGELRRRWGVLLLLGCAPLAGVGLHLAQNFWALGWDTVYATVAADYPNQSGPLIQIKIFLGMIANVLGYGQYSGPTRLEALREVVPFIWRNTIRLFYWPALLLPLPAFGFVFVQARRKTLTESTRRVAMLLVALIAGPLPWCVFMAALMFQPFMAGHWIPLYIAAMGGAPAMAATVVFRRGGAVWAKDPLALLILWIAYGQHVMMPYFQMPQSGLAPFARQLGQALPPKTGVVFNSAAVPFISYYMRHDAQLCEHPGMPFPQSLQTLRKCLPPTWRLQYFLATLPLHRPMLRELVAYCPATFLSRGGDIVLFDITPLELPPGDRKPLQPDIAQRQNAWMAAILQAGMVD